MLKGELPLGCIVAIAELSHCLKMVDEGKPQPHQIIIQNQSVLERTIGNWLPGKFAWQLENICAISPPIKAQGQQRLWIPSEELVYQIRKVQHG